MERDGGAHALEQIVVDNGDITDFGNDSWTENRSVKVRYARTFYLAVQQQGTVRSLGHWEGLPWIWNINLRRRLFDGKWKYIRISGSGLRILNR